MKAHFPVSHFKVFLYGNCMLKGPFIFALAAAFFTAANISAKYTTYPAGTICCLRFLVVSLVCAILIKGEVRKLFSRNNLLYHLLSLSFFVRVTLIIQGFRMTALAKPLAIILTWPVIFIAITAIFLKAPIHKTGIIALCLTVCGMFLVLGDPSLLSPGENFTGYSFMLIASVMTAVEMVLVRKPMQKLGIPAALLFSTLVMGVLSSPLVLELFTTKREVTDHLVALGLLFFITAGTGIFYYGLSQTSALGSAVFSYLEVPIATFAGVVFLNEKLSMQASAGIILIIVGTLSALLEKPLLDKQREALDATKHQTS